VHDDLLGSGRRGGPGADRAGRRSTTAVRRLGTVLAVLLLAVVGTVALVRLDRGRGDDPVRYSDAGCTVSVQLVPSCGAWTGVAPGSFTGRPIPKALAAFEDATGTPVDIVHIYTRSGELFPGRSAIAMTRQNGVRRLLFVNYKPEGGHTWADVAAGAMDHELDRVAAHLRSSYKDPFFFTVHHEPEDEVRPEPGSGYTATDYAAMFRHVVERLRQHGVTNAITVFDVTGFSGHGVKPWFGDLYPGDDVVDWVAGDLYACLKDDRPCGDFAGMMTGTYDPGWPGFYEWATTVHAGKPVMLGEWGVHETDDAHAKAAFVRGVAKQLPDFPAVKALVYFDAPERDGRGTDVGTSAAARSAFRALFADRYFRQRVR
jgi:hypothetical protein